MNYNPEFMKRAIELSIQNINAGGGPFAAVIVKDGEIIAECGNSVTLTNDPTAHAEINAIRSACRKLGTFDLSGCDIYSSCEPCPMCLSAIYWAHIGHLYYGNSKHDAAKIGFNDSFIYNEIKLKPDRRRLLSQQVMAYDAIRAFEIWEKKEDKIEY